MDNRSWIYNLPEDVLNRLGSCRSSKNDIPTLVNVRWKWMQGKEKFAEFTKEDALVFVLDLLDANSQYDLCDLTKEEYNILKNI